MSIFDRPTERLLRESISFSGKGGSLFTYSMHDISVLCKHVGATLLYRKFDDILWYDKIAGNMVGEMGTVVWILDPFLISLLTLTKKSLTAAAAAESRHDVACHGSLARRMGRAWPLRRSASESSPWRGSGLGGSCSG